MKKGKGSDRCSHAPERTETVQMMVLAFPGKTA